MTYKHVVHCDSDSSEALSLLMTHTLSVMFLFLVPKTQIWENPKIKVIVMEFFDSARRDYGFFHLYFCCGLYCLYFKCRVLGCWVWPGHTVTRVIRFTRLNVYFPQAPLSLYFFSLSRSPLPCILPVQQISHTLNSQPDTLWFMNCGNTCRPKDEVIVGEWRAEFGLRFGC